MDALELRAIAGDEGTRTNQVEGRETAAEHERRVKKLVQEREEREGVEEAKAVKDAEGADLSTNEGCARAAKLLGEALRDGVLGRGLAVARIVCARIFPDGPEQPQGEPSAESERADFEALCKQAAAFMRRDGDLAQGMVRARLVMWLGATFLNTFVSSNWTGPPPINTRFSPLGWHPDAIGGADGVKGLEELCMRAMEADSEIFYTGASLPLYLRAALCLLVECQPPDGCMPITHPWWAGRAVGTQQRLLQGRSGSLHSHLFFLLDDAWSRLEGGLAGIGEGEEGHETRDYCARLQLEKALAHSSFFNDKLADEALIRAVEHTRLKYEVTGKLGIRRKFQTNHLAQLVCLANSRSHTKAAGGEGGGGGEGGEAAARVGGEGEEEEDDGYAKHFEAGVKVVSKNVECDILDDVRLDEGQDIEEQAPLSSLDQAILLTRCAWNRRNRAKDSMNAETQAALVNRVVMHPTNWIVFSTSLLSRSRLELTKSQTIDRACLQMQVLADQYADEEPGASERLAFIYNVPFPPRWGLKKELAESMMKVGMLRTAAGLFQEVGLIKEMVECYIAMDEEQDAERIVNEQLEKRRTPYMLSVMGFLKKDVKWFEDAWEESGHRFAMARRWHANHCFQKQEFKRAVELYEEALAISPMYPDSWFKMGCAAMREEMWEHSVKAFLRVVQQEPESYEAWGNIGAVYMGEKNYEGALHAFQEAIKLRQDNWKMWQNALAAALGLRRVNFVLQAMSQLIQLKDKEVDVPVMALLVEEALVAVGKRDKGEASHADEYMINKVEELMQLASARVADDPKFWAVYARMCEGTGQNTTALECLRRVLRHAQKTGWHMEKDSFEEVVSALKRITEAYLKEGSRQSLFSANSALSSAIKKAQDAFEGTDQMGELRALQQRVADAREALPPP